MDIHCHVLIEIVLSPEIVKGRYGLRIALNKLYMGLEHKLIGMNVADKG